METRSINPYREVLKDSIENIFSKYKDLDTYRKNIEEHIGYAINSRIDNPDSYCQDLNIYIDHIFRGKGENKNIYSCHQELKKDIDRIFSRIKKSDPFRKGLENNIVSIFSKYKGLGSYRKELEARVGRIFSVDTDLDSYRFEFADSMDDIFISKPFALTKPFYEVYYKLEQRYNFQKPVISGNPYSEPCKLIEYGIIKDNLSGNSNYKSCMLLEHGIVKDNYFQICQICVNGIAQHEKYTQEKYAIIKSTLNAEVDKFGIFVFPSDYFLEPDDTKTIIQVRPEGIRAWLKRGFDEEIRDMFFNPVSEKPEIMTAETPNLDVSSGDDSKDRHAGKVKKEGNTDPFAGLNDKYVDQSEYMNCLTEQQHTAYSLHKEYNLSISEAARRMGISRASVYDLIADAERNISNNYKNSR